MPQRLMPKGLRPRMLALVIASVALPTLLIAAHEALAAGQDGPAQALIVAALLGLAGTLAAWWAVSGDVLSRLDALVAAVDRIRGGDLGARTGCADGPGEIAALARQFDVMAADLERRRDENARAEADLRASEARKSAVLEASLDGILLLDAGATVIECNAAARRMFGCSGERCVRHRLVELFPEAPPFEPAPGAAPGEVRETVCRRLDQSRFPVEISITAIRDAAAPGLYVATVRDITERRIWEHSLATLSLTDELTGLYNRRGFLMFAQQQLKLASRADCSVVLVGVDLDGLKHINDTYGHANGDRALVELADALRGSFRETDVIGRVGGDEFVVLATEAHGEGADQAIERLVRRIAGRNGQGDLPWTLSASVGWARTVPREAEDLNVLLENVDARMYEQKRRRTHAAAPRRDALASAR